MNEAECNESIAKANQAYIDQQEEIWCNYQEAIWQIRKAHLQSTPGRPGQTPDKDVPLVQSGSDVES